MQKRLDKIFPLHEIKNVSMYYVLSSVYNMWFVGGIWVFIWGKFMTKTEIGISDAITFTLGFLVELPSGVFADMIGRRRAILIGNILLTIGNFGVAFSSSFIGVTWWYLLWTIGYAFQSGATEALTYDAVKKAGRESEWHKVIGTSVVISRITATLAYPIGGLLFALGFRLPYLVFAITGIFGIIASYNLVEIAVAKIGSPWSFRSYSEQIKRGLSVLLKPYIFPVALTSLWISGMAYIYNWGFLRPLTGERFGYTAVTLPFLLVAVSISVIIATTLYIKNKDKVNTEKAFFYLSLIYIMVFFVMGYNLGFYIGGLIMILVTVFSSLAEQLFSKFINTHTDSSHRATTLSAVALLTKLPYVLMAIPIAILAERSLLPQFTIAMGIIAFFVWLFSRFKFGQVSHHHSSD